ncbi:methyltransferase [Nocardia alni]|uniref:methyltransferase n=1 Tax=Nocardia alni TaxID=2815723 RepID=UPI0020B25983|nr:methyltransferase [Nocardia alni]
MSPDIDGLVATLRAAGCVFAEDEAALLLEAATSSRELDALVAQRVSGTPLEYLLGWAEFRGLRVAVAPGVFVPRQRTGFLVEQAVSLALHDNAVAGGFPGVGRQNGDVGNVVAGSSTAMTSGDRISGRHAGTRGPNGDEAESADGPDASHGGRTCVVVDMCCGCGALGLATATELSAQGIRVELVASDVEPAAVACARRNLESLGASVYQGDLFAPLPSNLAGRVDVLLANVPYVPTAGIAEMPPEAREYEPHTALDGGPDGLDIFRRVVAAAPRWLAPGGRLLVESSREQLPAATEILAHQGLTPTIAESEELYATAVIGTWPTLD